MPLLKNNEELCVTGAEDKRSGQNTLKSPQKLEETRAQGERGVRRDRNKSDHAKTGDGGGGRRATAAGGRRRRCFGHVVTIAGYSGRSSGSGGPSASGSP
ncbi:hypothetical protein F511_31126 [Dorcoceras hygrometricum]|uniref:Uncharacterized protein n=1 Tax=Dorcoceras hygrometricum TaxID=472368 RepID=A0A2Z7CA84_9LAMI|nr:hypothetical protein F511_31126 [Dorcoceras hygrometricum]